MYLIMHAYVYIIITSDIDIHIKYILINIYEYLYITYTYICLYTSEMNDSTGTRDQKEELGLFHYYYVLILPVKRYCVIRQLA